MSIYIPIVSEFKNAGVLAAKKGFKDLEGVGAKASFAIKKAALPATLALGALAAAAGKAIAAGEAVSTANARIEQINESMSLFGKSSGKVTARLIKLAEATARQTGVDNLSIKATQAKLLTFANLAKTADKLGGAFDRANQAAIDMAAAGFGSAEGNAVQLGKALDNPIKGIAALAKSGVTFTEQEKEKIKVLVESNRMLEAQEMILTAIEKQVGGTAVATANQTDKMKESFAQATQAIGQGLLPILDAVTPYLLGFANLAKDNAEAFKIAGGVIAALAVSILAVNAAIKIWMATTQAFTAVQKLFNAVLALNPVVLIVIGVVALVAALVIAYKKFDSFRALVDTIFSGIKTGFKSVVDAVTTYVTTLVGIYKGLFNGIATLWNNTVGKLSFKVPSWIPNIGGKGFDVPNIPILDNGGIVSSPTLALLAANSRPEAIIPLDRMGKQGGGTTEITINVNGGDPNQIINAIQRYVRQSGAVALTSRAI